MITVQWVRELVEQITYKPGWKFEYVPAASYGWPAQYTLGIDPFSPGVIIVTARVPDSRQPDREIEVSGRYIVPEYLDESYFIKWFKDGVILPSEFHEVDEFFRVAGVLVNDPHSKKTEVKM